MVISKESPITNNHPEGNCWRIKRSSKQSLPAELFNTPLTFQLRNTDIIKILCESLAPYLVNKVYNLQSAITFGSYGRLADFSAFLSLYTKYMICCWNFMSPKLKANFVQCHMDQQYSLRNFTAFSSLFSSTLHPKDIL